MQLSSQTVPAHRSTTQATDVHLVPTVLQEPPDLLIVILDITVATMSWTLLPVRGRKGCCYGDDDGGLGNDDNGDDDDDDSGNCESD